MAMLCSIEVLCLNNNGITEIQSEINAIKALNVDNRIDQLLTQRNELKSSIEYNLRLVYEFFRDFVQSKISKNKNIKYINGFGSYENHKNPHKYEIKDELTDKINEFIKKQSEFTIKIDPKLNPNKCSSKFTKTLSSWNLKKLLNPSNQTDYIIYQKLLNLINLNEFDCKTEDPILCIFYINHLIDKEKYKTAALFFIKKQNIFKNCSRLVLKLLTEKQIILIRAMFNSRNWRILKHISKIILIDAKTSNYDELLSVQAISGIILNDNFLFYSRLQYIYLHSKSTTYKSMACFFLGTIYNSKDSNKWLTLGFNEKNCIWSMLCGMYLKQKLHFVSVVNLKPEIDLNENYIHLKKAYDAYLLNKYKLAISHIYSFFNKKDIKLCKKSIFYLRKICQTRSTTLLFQIGNLFLKKSGIILKEAFLQARYVTEMLENNEISGIMSAYVSSIIGVETKYLDYSPNTLISECHALGVMQVAEKSALSICKKKGWFYDRNRLLIDHKFNIKVANGIILDHLRYCNNNILLSIICHNGGLFMAHRSKQFNCLDLNKIHNVMLLNYMIIGPRSRTYLLHVLEHFIIYYYFLYNKMPSVNLINEFKHDTKTKKK